MPRFTAHGPLADALRDIFAPGCWYVRASRVLDCSPRFVYMLADGSRKLGRRHKRILDTYARNRAGAASSEIKAAEARARRRAQADLARLEQARQTIRALLKESG